MATQIDLKLNLKGFSGTLENGKKYRVFLETKPITTTNEYSLELVVKTNPTIGDLWLYDVQLSTRGYFKKGGYKHCLKSLLVQLENKLGVQLLKSTMKVAV